LVPHKRMKELARRQLDHTAPLHVMPLARRQASGVEVDRATPLDLRLGAVEFSLKPDSWLDVESNLLNG